jgi:cation transport regulator ChaB
MPFSSINDPELPDDVRKLSSRRRNVFVSTFNSVLEQCEGEIEQCEGRAFSVARSAAKKFAVSDLTEKIRNLFPSVHKKALKGVFDSGDGFKTLNDNLWVAWYTNSYKDRDREWFHHGAIEKDIEGQWFSEKFPELWFFHIESTKHGEAIWTGVMGKFAVAIGKFDDTPLAETFKEFYKKNKMSLSHGFKFNPDLFIENVYYDFETFEISTLPPTAASNIFTSFTLEKGEKMSKELNPVQMDALLKVFEDDEEMAQKLIDAAEQKTRLLDENNVESKQVEDEEEEEIEEKEEGDEEEEVAATDDDEEEKASGVEDRVKAIEENLLKISEILGQMVADNQEKQSRAQQSPTLIDSRRQALINDRQLNLDKQQAERDNSPAAQLHSHLSGGG